LHCKGLSLKQRISIDSWVGRYFSTDDQGGRTVGHINLRRFMDRLDTSQVLERFVVIDKTRTRNNKQTEGSLHAESPSLKRLTCLSVL